ncbi:ATP-binding protein [Alcanivorax sp. DP30]|uniref:ATP-binding protein n=1 Tax=Alcanivorax sp. DP30 TaxID=2606217 RepID=UPI001370E6EC|nr:ATP-binding protein [Alcanivorax sp. DP30]MZR62839.1 AAA family ATPase [Alcanivorax sp. DP30]
MGSHRRQLPGFVMACLLLLLPLARAATPACEEAEQLLISLEREYQQLQNDRQQLQRVIDGQIPSHEQLETLIGHSLDSPLITLPSTAPSRSLELPECPSLNSDLEAIKRQLEKQDQALLVLRHQITDRNLTQRRAMVSLTELNQQLESLLSADTLDPGIRQGALLLQDNLASTWALIPRLDEERSQQARAQLDQLWYDSPTLNAPVPVTEAYRTLIKIRLDIQRQIRVLRGDIWQRRQLARQIADFGGLSASPALVAREAQRIGQRAIDTMVLVRYDLNAPIRGSGYLPLVQNVLALVLGIAGFVLLVKLARRTRHWALSLHEKVISMSGDKRWVRNASRLISGLAPMLPWFLLWMILDQLDMRLNTPSTKVLFWLLPFAHLYVIYGLLCLMGEWLLGRVAQSAGTYLSGDPAQQVIEHSRGVARWLMLPWLPLLVIWESLGPSLLYYLMQTVLGVCLYIALSRLLTLRSKDYLVCLQAILPSRLDPIAERLLGERYFPLFAPLLLPVALISFLVGFIDRVLTDFDWYVSFKARWFRLRTRIASDEGNDQATDQDDEVEIHYERWFAQDVPEGSKLPFIDTGLVAAIEKSIQRWHEDKTDENALVVAGEKGSGKSISISKLKSALESSCESLKVIDIKVPARTTMPADILALVGDTLDVELGENGAAALVKSDEDRTPTLVVLDEAQNFFLAQQGGLEGWRQVLSLVNARLDNVFWLLLINNQSWAYLCNVFGRDYQFRNVIKVKRWAQSDIRSLILSRNHLSGYKVRYDEVLLSSRGPEAGNVRNAEQRYFSLLWDACRGNPLVALRLWLTSIKVQGRDVLVGLPTPPSASLLDNMGENALFVYAAIATHGTLTSNEISGVTCLPENVVGYALKGGFDAGFLQKAEDGRYRLVPLWYQPVISYLTRKNLLNE